jgi:hypothetical protein
MSKMKGRHSIKICEVSGKKCETRWMDGQIDVIAV